MRESTIEKAVTAHAKKLGWMSLKLSGAHDRGKPDRMYLRRGVAVFVEFKAPGKLPTALQMKWLKDLYTEGFTTTWCDNAEIGKQLFDRMEP
jgi:hypothetical protein